MVLASPDRANHFSAPGVQNARSNYKFSAMLIINSQRRRARRFIRSYPSFPWCFDAPGSTWQVMSAAAYNWHFGYNSAMHPDGETGHPYPSAYLGFCLRKEDNRNGSA